MNAARCAATALLVTIALSTYVTSVSSRAQLFGFAGGSSGGGAVSPSVVATWEARFEPAPGQQVADPSAVPLMLDLLVLWRGRPGWFDEASLSASVGGLERAHRVASRGRSLELRFDREAGTVQIQGQTIPLLGAKVILVDNVDDPNALAVAGTLQVDPAISPGRPAQSGLAVHPLSAIIKRSPELFEYLRCDPAFTDPSDPHSTMRLRSCEQLR